MKKQILSSIMFGSLLQLSATAEEADFLSAITNSTTKVTIGSYMEGVDSDKSGSESHWGTAYVDAKFETASWNRLQFGIGFLGHHELFSKGHGANDPYNNDVEEDYTIPELYLKYNVGEKSSIVVGRYKHSKISHIEGSNSEGAYFEFKENDKFEVTVGLMRKFAELDYDDGEDFGANNDSKDLGEYEDAGNLLYFVESKIKFNDESIIVNPYIMTQSDHATVTGLDTDFKYDLENDSTIGTRVDMYNVFAEAPSESDSFNWAISPYLKSGIFTYTIGYAQFDDGMNKPKWLNDYLVGELDQDRAYGASDCSVIFGKVRADFGNVWAHFAAGQYDYDADKSLELELQAGYKLTEKSDINIRLFDVSYDHADDYQKIEAHLRYTF